MLSGKTQMAIMAWSVAAITLGSALYVAIAQPPYLLKSRYGVPHLTPMVADPATGKGIPVDVLVRSYRGEEASGKVYY